MARVTVEDCIVRIPNRFELVLVAAQRGREISTGAPLTLDRDNDKNPVVALREIADGTVNVETLRNSLVKSMQKHVEHDEPDDDEMEALPTNLELLTELGVAALDDELSEDGMTIQENPSSLDDESDSMAGGVAENGNDENDL